MQQPDQLQFQMQQRVKQQQLIMQQALLQQQQQQSLYHPALLTAMSQIEPIPSGNLPPGFDSSSCRSVYVGNIHVNVTQSLLADVFGSVGPLEACKLISKDKSSFGFVDYFDHRSAAAAIIALNGKQIFGQPIKVNWAYASGQREDTSGHYSIFVGDLSPEVTDATLFACFSVYQSCSDARVMWDQKSGRSRGFGFVSFRNQQDAQNAINELTGKWLGSRQIRCNWAAKSNSGNQNDEKQNTEMEISLNVANIASTNGGANEMSKVNQSTSAGSTEGHKENTAQGAGPENNLQYTTVYVGNLTHEVTQSELHRQFHALGAGVIEDVRVQRDKGFGFVRYHSHAEAALAIQMANGRVICGKSIKCSWGSKPTPPGTASIPLPPPPAATYQVVAAPGLNQGYTAADLLAYQRQLSMSQGASGQALLQVSGQQGLGQASVGLGAATNRSMYDIGQQLMYY